ncbi:hypothetical protein PA7_32960 [Pseudonocardia asaccharolytica DSM 44247 = NBRC 16224]|uniref:HTH luxR-type domain-containing protein n=1 Tax=Pseudonocardia asaccharolytica DSM 44247 = NBRC 16224 TaxID=1123024 RepID=A0A511D3V3_9PSEU|nr:hypothetical protein PA7_32960 [Pseudonocardia asaccharolytica DSM 44247 = NBRC 16224]
MAEGRSNNGIAAALVVSGGAVEKHISSIFAKLALPAGATDHRRVLAVLRYLGVERMSVEHSSRPRHLLMGLAVLLVLGVVTLGVGQLLSQTVGASSTQDSVLTPPAPRLDIRTTSTGLRSAVVSGETSSGSLDIGLVAPLRELSLRADSGDVDVTVPGGRPYRVESETDAGEKQVLVPTDPAADATIRAATSSGDVTIRPR